MKRSVARGLNTTDVFKALIHNKPLKESHWSDKAQKFDEATAFPLYSRVDRPPIRSVCGGTVGDLRRPRTKSLQGEPKGSHYKSAFQESESVAAVEHESRANRQIADRERRKLCLTGRT
jgi:hypothetical protein